MADNLQATPRNELLGLLSDAMYGGLDWMKDPRRSQQMQGLAGLLESTGIPQTTQRMAYGEPLTNIGRANVPLLKPETAEAMMNVAPLMPAAVRLASRAVKATEGMPVGMSIKDVSPKIGINVNQGGSSFADKIISGEKKFETRESDSLRSYVGKRVGIIRTGEGKAKAIGDVTLGEPIVISSPEEFAKLRDLHLVPEGSKFDIKEGGVKYLYPIENPVAYEVEKDVGKYGIVSRKILGEPDTLEKALYPQQAALDLAQQRAALPVSEGGLGLLAGNTPMDRAKAMGFDVNTPLYHATDVDFQSIRPSLQGKLGAGVYVSPSSKYAEKYTSLNAAGNARVLPLVARGKLADDDLVMNIAESIRQEMATQNPNFSVSEWKKRTTQALADAGYDGRNMSGLESVITNPDNLRSRFAAFDPFRKDVATATAMGVALPDLLAAEPTPQPQSSGLLYPFP